MRRLSAAAGVDERVSGVTERLTTVYRTVGRMVYDVLKSAVLSGVLPPGQWLRQESLAAAIGVSRISVRTALLQLESEGLVIFYPHRGARVRTLTADQINEIFRLRILLECHALERSAAAQSNDRTAALKSLARQLDDHQTEADFLDLRVQFYRQLYDAENNPLLVELIENLRNNVGRYLLGFRLLGDHRHRHLELAEHLERGDLGGADNWLRAHLEQVRQGMISAMENGLVASAADVPVREEASP